MKKLGDDMLHPENLSADLAGLLARFPESKREVLVIDFEKDSGKGFGLFYGNTEEEKAKLHRNEQALIWGNTPDPNDELPEDFEDRSKFFKDFSGPTLQDNKGVAFLDTLIQFLNAHKEIKRLDLKAAYAPNCLTYIENGCNHLKKGDSPKDKVHALPSNTQEVELEERRRKEEEWYKAVPKPKGREFCPVDCDVDIWGKLSERVIEPQGYGFDRHAIWEGLSIWGGQVLGHAHCYSSYGFERINEQEVTKVTKTCLAWCKENNVKKLNLYDDAFDLSAQQAFLKELEKDKNLEQINVDHTIGQEFASCIKRQLAINLAGRIGPQQQKELKAALEGCDYNVWDDLNKGIKSSPAANGLCIYSGTMPLGSFYTTYALKDGADIAKVAKTCLAWCKYKGVKKLNLYAPLELGGQEAFLEELKKDSNLEEINFRNNVYEEAHSTFAEEAKVHVSKNKNNTKPVPATQPNKVDNLPEPKNTESLRPTGKEPDESYPLWSLLSCILLGANAAMLLKGDAWAKGLAFLVLTNLSAIAVFKASKETREQPLIKYGFPALLSLALAAQIAHLAR